MTYRTLAPVPHLYYGLYPDAPDPFYQKWNYLSKPELDRKADTGCLECTTEDLGTRLNKNNFRLSNRVIPDVGVCHYYEGRSSNGMPPTMFHRHVPCSRFWQDNCDISDYELQAERYGLYYEVPWCKYRSQRHYLKPNQFQTFPEMDMYHPIAWSTDKTNTSLIVTNRGYVRFTSGIRHWNGEAYRDSWFEQPVTTVSERLKY